MKCKNCSKEISKGKEYCESCEGLLKDYAVQKGIDVDSTKLSDIAEHLPALDSNKALEDKPKKKKKHTGLFIFLGIIALPTLLIFVVLFYFIMGNIGAFEAPDIQSTLEFGQLDMEEYLEIDDDYDLKLAIEYDTLNAILAGLIDGDMIPDNLPVQIDDLFVDTEDVRVFVNVSRKSINIPISFEPEIYDDGQNIDLTINKVKYSKFNLPIPAILLKLIPDTNI